MQVMEDCASTGRQYESIVADKDTTQKRAGE